MSTAPFFSPNQSKNLERVAAAGMIQSITILRRTAAPAPSAAEDYGDDALTFSPTIQSKYTTVMGWIYSKPTIAQIEDTGQIITVNTYRCLLPLETDIQPGDEVLGPVTDEEPLGQSYTVSDVTDANTWSTFLKCNLRKRE